MPNAAKPLSLSAQIAIRKGDLPPAGRFRADLSPCRGRERHQGQLQLAHPHQVEGGEATVVLSTNSDLFSLLKRIEPKGR
jgi:hypothetical protein